MWPSESRAVIVISMTEHSCKTRLLEGLFLCLRILDVALKLNQYPIYVEIFLPLRLFLSLLVVKFGGGILEKISPVVAIGFF